MSQAQTKSPSVVFVSNGHGEDVVGARVAAHLLRLRPELRVGALPLVGLGEPYREADVELLGPRRQLPSGGLLMHSFPSFVADMRAGFLGLTLSQLRFLLGLRCHVLVVVGDLYAQMLAALVRAPARFVIQTLVSAYHSEGLVFSAPNRYFMERITLPEQLLMRHRAHAVYVRDRYTEAALHEAGVVHARFLGNPIADGLEGVVPAGVAGERRVVALLPGSRGYRGRALKTMLAALERLPAPVTGLVAWLGEEFSPPEGWIAVPVAPEDDGLLAEFRKGSVRVLVYRDRFPDVLRAARLALGTSGTANEQAVAVGLPVVAFPVLPDYSSAFLENQKRLLGPALAVASEDPDAVADAVRIWLDDPATAERAGRQGRARIGRPGGSEAIAADLLQKAFDLRALSAGISPANT